MIYTRDADLQLMISGLLQFGIGYQTLRGKKCLFPFGLHCTGMPIKVSVGCVTEMMHSEVALGLIIIGIVM